MKDIKDYEGLYGITSCGKVWSYRSNKFLKPYMAGSDLSYQYVHLIKDGVSKNFRVHRLVAEAYIPNPNNLPEVNHKDEIKTNNYVSNLEWCDRDYNHHYGTQIERARKTRGKPIYCQETDKVYGSQKEAAAELGLDQGNISKVCCGILSHTGGYHFEFANQEESK